MISVTTVGFIVTGVGLAISALIGRACRSENTWVMLVAFVFAAGFLGVALMLGTIFLYGACESVRLCEKTTDMTVFLVALPLIYSPAYWVLMTIFMHLGRSCKGEKPKA
jgi:K+ transporter